MESIDDLYAGQYGLYGCRINGDGTVSLEMTLPAKVGQKIIALAVEDVKRQIAARVCRKIGWQAQDIMPIINEVCERRRLLDTVQYGYQVWADVVDQMTRELSRNWRPQRTGYVDQVPEILSMMEEIIDKLATASEFKNEKQ